MMFLSPQNLMKIQFIMAHNNNNNKTSQTQHYLESSWSSSQCQWRVSISGWRRPSCICCLCNDSQLKSSPEALSLKPFFPSGQGWTVEAFVGWEVDPLQPSRRPWDIVVAAAAGGLWSGQAGLNTKLTENPPAWAGDSGATYLVSGHGESQGVGVRSLVSGGRGRQGGGGRLGRLPGELGGSGDLQRVEVIHSSHVVDGHFSF